MYNSFVSFTVWHHLRFAVAVAAAGSSAEPSQPFSVRGTSERSSSVAHWIDPKPNVVAPNVFAAKSRVLSDRVNFVSRESRVASFGLSCLVPRVLRNTNPASSAARFRCSEIRALSNRIFAHGCASHVRECSRRCYESMCAIELVCVSLWM